MMRIIFTFVLTLAVAAVSSVAQIGERTVADLYQEIEKFESARRAMLISSGKRYDKDAQAEIFEQRRSLAKKYAEQLESRADLKEKDLYYLGRIYTVAENDKKTVETMRRFVAQYPADASGDMMQSALSFIIVLSSRTKQMEIAEDAFRRWKTGTPLIKNQQPTLADHIANGYLKDGNYEKAMAHAQEAFDLLKTLSARSISEKRARETVYMNLVEILALGYKKTKNSEQALNVLAEARAQSFTIPSANLYRKVMTFVEGAGFSEKKLMQKVEAYTTADAAPEIKVTEWIGQEAATLEQMRGRIVLLDFWATWCGPCIATFPRLRGWHKKFSPSDFVIIGVTQYYGEQEGKKVTQLQELEFLREFKQKHKLPYGFAITPPGEAASKYGISIFPTTVLLDRNGVVRYIGIGSGAEESENLEDTIKKILKEETRLATTQ